MGYSSCSFSCTAKLLWITPHRKRAGGAWEGRPVIAIQRYCICRVTTCKKTLPFFRAYAEREADDHGSSSELVSLGSRKRRRLMKIVMDRCSRLLWYELFSSFMNVIRMNPRCWEKMKLR
jgi:hypothetical protein